MDWTADEEREQLMRIVVLLLGLSALAERACRAPARVRVSVLCFLRPAEQAAWSLLAEEVALPGGEGNDPASVMLLAARFRALALMLAFLACDLGGRDRAGLAPMAAEAAAHFAGRCSVRGQGFDTS
ncbi:hypothetical protein ASD44_08250 [Mesorhizobium sp. Root554]|uniref:hypothetical protein n=1 Tax=unclassified Mesorhizobium TaxID=325217 RepID=UPI0006F488ED|nr:MULTISPECIES: hypothetical protein [unclassified Mesorhizobium]KQZ14070.1 hypothetical protein ASD27_08260 [Mesorhizobium sp. Root1471]KQZ36582.1 hypothetical protein ASD44_08250 [Mesorhizobium sp. Root554]